MLPVDPSTAMFFPGRVMGELGKEIDGAGLKLSSTEKVALYGKLHEAATWFQTGPAAGHLMDLEQSGITIKPLCWCNNLAFRPNSCSAIA